MKVRTRSIASAKGIAWSREIAGGVTGIAGGIGTGLPIDGAANTGAILQYGWQV